MRRLRGALGWMLGFFLLSASATENPLSIGFRLSSRNALLYTPLTLTLNIRTQKALGLRIPLPQGEGLSFHEESRQVRQEEGFAELSIRYAVFPKTTGSLAIRPFEVAGLLPSDAESSPSFHAAIPSLSIEVSPLPPPPQPEFNPVSSERVTLSRALGFQSPSLVKETLEATLEHTDPRQVPSSLFRLNPPPWASAVRMGALDSRLVSSRGKVSTHVTMEVSYLPKTDLQASSPLSLPRVTLTFYQPQTGWTTRSIQGESLNLPAAPPPWQLLRPERPLSAPSHSLTSLLLGALGGVALLLAGVLIWAQRRMQKTEPTFFLRRDLKILWPDLELALTEGRYLRLESLIRRWLRLPSGEDLLGACLSFASSAEDSSLIRSGLSALERLSYSKKGTKEDEQALRLGLLRLRRLRLRRRRLLPFKVFGRVARVLVTRLSPIRHLKPLRSPARQDPKGDDSCD